MVKIVANQAFSFNSLYLPDADDYGLFALLQGSGRVELGDQDGSLVMRGRFTQANTSERITRLTFEDADGDALATFTKLGNLNESNIASVLSGSVTQAMGRLLSRSDNVTLSSGNDVFRAFGGDDRVYGRGGNDKLFGGNGEDRLEGGSGHDTLSGGAHEDLLKGGSGNDRLMGGGDDDELSGGRGKDLLIGGSGEDEFIFQRGSSAIDGNRDTIRDFRSGVDEIDLSSLFGRNDDADFIGTREFSGTGAEVRYRGGIVWVDSDGDGDADLSIRLANSPKLVADDLDL